MDMGADYYYYYYKEFFCNQISFKPGRNFRHCCECFADFISLGFSSQATYRLPITVMNRLKEIPANTQD